LGKDEESQRNILNIIKNLKKNLKKRQVLTPALLILLDYFHYFINNPPEVDYLQNDNIIL